ncbi:MAG: DUF5722 domain-containing protein, partial [Eubacteriales bacterium]|nr:DUF5722 domain-containing protein [Eubacteriales bacterium]
SYAQDMDFAPCSDFDYPLCDTKKGLQVAMIDDAIDLGVKHAALNVCIGDFMRSSDGGSAIVFRHDGCDWYFERGAVEACDRRIKNLSDHGIIISLILLCALRWSGDTPEDMRRPLIHPDYIGGPEGGRLSAFNVMTDEGVRHMAAFAAFLARRYTDPSERYGRAVGLIISNEVNSQWIWGNAGHKTIDEYAYEYTTALRLAYQAACSVWRNMRIYISLDHFWTGSQNPAETTKYYGSRPLLEHINRCCADEGDMPWNIAFHPYPENLNYPDFWNDGTAEDCNDTYRVTFKNLGVLTDFIAAPEHLYKGEKRRVILSEQGFNSHWTPESEILQAAAYGRAYRAVMEQPEIDSFILHAHCDNREEFGLNLGLWRRKKDGPGMDEPKPIYYVFRAIDKKDETGKYHWERY